MSVERAELLSHLDEFLQVGNFSDYCPNGLQVAGRESVSTIVTGVTACQALIDKAIALKADLILVHHGFFWKGEAAEIVGMKHQRIAGLIKNDINLVAYHLPLDAHPELGNNAMLAKVLDFPNAQISPSVKQDLLWYCDFETPVPLTTLEKNIQLGLNRTPTVVSAGETDIKRLAWCTGGAQDYIEQAKWMGADAFISGEASERTFHLAKELGIHYVAAGHHATERYGVKSLGAYLADRYQLAWHHIDIDNPF